MKPNLTAIGKTIIVLIILVILPLTAQIWLPPGIPTIIATQSGFDLIGLLNRIAIIGIALSILILARGHTDKQTKPGLALSAIWKITLLVVVLFILGFGYPETFGQTTIGGKAGPAENIVVFDFRLFAILATIVVALMIVRSIMQFQETKPKPASA